MTLLLIFAIVLFIAGAIMNAFNYKEEIPLWRNNLTLMLILWAGMAYGVWTVRHNKCEFSKSKYELIQKTEGKLLNGNIIESDTLYVLTRKK